MIVTQHIPTFIDIDSGRVEVQTLDDVFRLPWVARWTTKGPVTWMRSDELLMAVYPSEFWVVAYVDPASALDPLPTWRAST